MYTRANFSRRENETRRTGSSRLCEKFAQIEEKKQSTKGLGYTIIYKNSQYTVPPWFAKYAFDRRFVSTFPSFIRVPRMYENTFS